MSILIIRHMILNSHDLFILLKVYVIIISHYKGIIFFLLPHRTL